MVRALIIVLLLVPGTMAGQESDESTATFNPHKGMWRAQATISLGQKRGGFTHMYLHGDLGYHLTDQVELRGEGYYFLNTLGDTTAFEYNHQLMAGALFHFETDGSIDPYMGIQPGVAFSLSSAECPDDTQDALEWQCVPSTNPIFSFVAGANYYAPKLFHLFAQVRYVRGVHLGEHLPVHLDELRFSFGLGFNIR